VISVVGVNTLSSLNCFDDVASAAQTVMDHLSRLVSGQMHFVAQIASGLNTPAQMIHNSSVLGAVALHGVAVEESWFAKSWK